MQRGITGSRIPSKDRKWKTHIKTFSGSNSHVDIHDYDSILYPCVVNTGRSVALGSNLDKRLFSPVWDLMISPIWPMVFSLCSFYFDIWLMLLSGLIYNNWGCGISRSRTTLLGRAVDGHMACYRSDLAYYLLVMGWSCYFIGRHCCTALV